MSRSAIALLSTENLHHNLRVIQKMVHPAKIIGMVKANAYGHGIRSVGLRLQNHVDILGVASIDEALALRKAGVKSPVMVTQGLYEARDLLLASVEKIQVVFNDSTQLPWLEKITPPLPLQSWVKIDTGLGRLGFNPLEGRKVYERLVHHPHIAQPVRILSHFSCADIPEHPLNAQQMTLFRTFIRDLKTEYSLCNSAGILHFPDVYYDYVRPGMLMYGVSPLKGKTAQDFNLKPVMTVQSALISVQVLKKGSFIGYGARYACPEDMPVGIIAFGYGDGYPFTARDGTPVLVNTVECPLVGRISMDMIAVDLRPCPRAQVGDPVTLWGNGLPLERVAENTSNIVWDIMTSVQNRVNFLWTSHYGDDDT